MIVVSPKFLEMRKIVLVAFILFRTSLFSQTIVQRDPVIEQMVHEVSPDSLQSHITRMVSFGTRSTISAQTDTKKGIAAARNYVLSKFNEFAKQSGGRLTAVIDTTTIPADGKRVDRPTLLGNVMAT